MTEPYIWYVSYRSNITPKRENGERRCARATRKFKAKTEARQFARERLDRDCRDLESLHTEEDRGIHPNSGLDRRQGLSE